MDGCDCIFVGQRRSLVHISHLVVAMFMAVGLDVATAQVFIEIKSLVVVPVCLC